MSAARRNLKEADGKARTRRTGTGSKAFTIGNPAMDGDAKYLLGGGGGKSGAARAKEAWLTLGGLSVRRGDACVSGDYPLGNEGGRGGEVSRGHSSSALAEGRAESFIAGWG